MQMPNDGLAGNLNSGRLQSVIYLQHVDQAWIRQRPQNLAMELARLVGSVRVLFLRSWRRTGMSPPDPTPGLQPRPIIASPFWTKWPLGALDALAIKTQIASSLRCHETPDIVWVTHPRLWPAVATLPSEWMVVYDCMDDAEVLAGGSTRVRALEDRLLARADVVFATSPQLMAACRERTSRPVHLLRNGIDGSLAWPVMGDLREKPANPGEVVSVVFFGTLGPWLDQELLLELAKQPGIRLDMYGPVRGALNPGLRGCIRGSLPHGELMHRAASADWLILPFRPDKFAETIDPVKMYEYVALGVRILAPRLEVLSQFAPFVHFYESRAGAVRAATHREQVLSEEWQARARFIIEHTWRERAQAAVKIIESMDTK